MDLTLNEVMGIGALVVSVLGIPLTYVLTRRGRQRPDIRYAVDFDILLRPDDGLAGQGLFLSFSGSPITRVSRAYVALWNHRGDTVHGADIVPTDPLRIAAPGDEKILQARVLCVSRIQTDARVALDRSGNRAAEIYFDFLDARDGFVVEIVHEGEKRPSIEGTIRGAVVRNRGGTTLTPSRLRDLRSSWLRRLRTRAKNDGISITASLMLLGLGIMLLVLLTRFVYTDPELIDPTRHDMTTLAGQRAFADAVVADGIQPFQPYLLVLLFMALFAMALSVRSLFRLRLKVPRTIFRQPIDPAGDE